MSAIRIRYLANAIYYGRPLATMRKECLDSGWTEEEFYLTYKAAELFSQWMGDTDIYTTTERQFQ